jgi:hypothetical protein
VIRLTLASTMLLAMASATPVFAESGGDDSAIAICQNNLVSQQLAVTAEKDPARHEASNGDLAKARSALTHGNGTGCLAALQQSQVDLR